MAAARASWIDGVVSSFQSNIMQEKRYLLIWDGLTTTTLIAVLSAARPRIVVVCPAGVVTPFQVLDASERVGAAENLEATVERI